MKNCQVLKFCSRLSQEIRSFVRAHISVQKIYIICLPAALLKTLKNVAEVLEIVKGFNVSGH